MSVQLATTHIWRTVDGRFVDAGDPDAAFLAAAPGDPEPAGYKRRQKPADKQAKPSADKAATSEG